ncbi:MAG: type II toxin-antitoxin system VapC family toxin [Candidatus Woesearchaeota archaeon]
MIWVDASVWLEIALKQGKAQLCEQFLESARKEALFISDFDLYSIVLTMLKYKKTNDDIKKLMGVFAGFPKITIFRPSPLLIAEAVDAMKPLKLTIDDSISYACMRHLGIKKLATLDSDFRKLDVEYVI